MASVEEYWRNNTLWVGHRFMVPEHRAGVTDQDRAEREAVAIPCPSEDELARISEAVNAAYHQRTAITLVMTKGGRLSEVTGVPVMVGYGIRLGTTAGIVNVAPENVVGMK